VVGKIRLYGYWRSAATYRVRIALALKGLTFEEEAVDLMADAQFAGEVAMHNPANAVPVLIDGGPALTQSLAIIEYLEERYPDPPLYPREPSARAAARAFALISIADAHPLQVPRVRRRLVSQFGASEGDIVGWSKHWYELALEAMEERLGARARQTRFCFADAPGIGDIALAAHLAGARGLGITPERYPHVAAIHSRCAALEAFSRLAPEALKPAGMA
jgi:maleylacetoacetate isomerase